MSTVGFKDIVLVSPMLVLFLASLVPIAIKALRSNVEPSPLSSLIQGLVGIVAAAVLLLVVSGTGASAFSEAIVLDGLSRWMGIVALLAAGFSLLLMHDNKSTNGDQFAELVFLTLGSVLGMLILVSAVDLLVLFIGLELMSLSLYLMIGMSHEQRLSKESSFKYFVLGGLASAILLYGVAMLFGATGTTSLSAIIEKTPELIQSSRIFLIGIILVIIGFLFKISIFPFHAWTPDVYQGAPTPHTAFMATAVKTVSIAAFMRILLTDVLNQQDQLFTLLQWLAVGTMIVGNVAAIIQNNFKRVLAYSSIAHSGYLLVGLIAMGISSNASVSASSIVFYLFSYTLMTLGAIAVVSLIEKDENTIVTVDNLGGYSKKHPWMAFSLTLFMLSLAGIPPTIGFFSKFYLFSAALGEGLTWLVIWGVLNSVISVYYYLRPIVVMYMKDADEIQSHELAVATQSVVLISAVLIVFLGIFSGPILGVFKAALQI